MKGYWLCVVFIAGCGSVSEKPDAAAAPTVTVTVVKDGTGLGSVTSQPSGIDCGAACVGEFEEGAAVVLTATAEAGSTFMGWGGGCTGSNSCVFTANSNAAISATFVRTSWPITVTKSGTGTGTVTSAATGIDCGTTCTSLFPINTTVTLTATPAAGQSFVGWTGGTCTGKAPCAVSVTSEQTVNAEFSNAKLYLIDDQTDMLQRIGDLGTPALTPVGPLGINYEFGDCAFNSTDGMIYAVDGRPTTPTNSLYRLNTTTGAATLVGAHGIADVFALGYHPPTNTLYGVGSPSYTLYRFNMATGAATLIGPTGYTNGLAWDSKRNRMVAVTSGGTFNTIDLTTGTQTAIPGAGSVLGNNNGIAYDVANDLFWMSTYTSTGGVSKFDPNTNFTGTNYALAGAHTCITYVP